MLKNVFNHLISLDLDNNNRWDKFCEIKVLTFDQFKKRIKEFGFEINDNEFLIYFKKAQIDSNNIDFYSFQLFLKFYINENELFKSILNDIKEFFFKNEIKILNYFIKNDENKTGLIEINLFDEVFQIINFQIFLNDLIILKLHYSTNNFNLFNYYFFLYEIHQLKPLKLEIIENEIESNIRGPGNGGRGPLDPEIFRIRKSFGYEKIEQKKFPQTPQPIHKKIENNIDSLKTINKTALMISSRFKYTVFFNKWQKGGILTLNEFNNAIKNEFGQSLSNEEYEKILELYGNKFSLSTFMKLFSQSSLTKDINITNNNNNNKFVEDEVVLEWISQRIKNKNWKNLILNSKNPSELTNKLHEIQIYVEEKDILKLMNNFTLEEIVNSIEKYSLQK